MCIYYNLAYFVYILSDVVMPYHACRYAVSALQQAMCTMSLLSSLMYCNCLFSKQLSLSTQTLATHVGTVQWHLATWTELSILAQLSHQLSQLFHRTFLHHLFVYTVRAEGRYHRENDFWTAFACFARIYDID